MKYLFYFLNLIPALALLATGCSKSEIADKVPDPAPNGAVTLNSNKPTVLGNTSATISFRVEKPQGSVEYGAILTSDSSQVNAIKAGTTAPLSKSVGAAFPLTGSVDFDLTGLSENKLYYAVPYVKEISGKKTFSNATVVFQTKYTPKNGGIWRQLANLPTMGANTNNPIFTINGKVYVGGAATSVVKEGYFYFKQLYEYDPQSNLWTRKKDFPGAARTDPTVTVLNGKGYIMFGVALGGDGYTPDAWEYDPATDGWKQLANPPENAPPLTSSTRKYNLQAGGIPFIYNNRIHMLFGRGAWETNPKKVDTYSTMYALDPIANTWNLTFPLNESGHSSTSVFRTSAFSFQYDKWVYFGGGLNPESYDALFVYDRTNYFLKNNYAEQVWAYNVETKAVKKVTNLPNDFSYDYSTKGMTGTASVLGTKAYITDAVGKVWVMDLTTGLFPTTSSVSLRLPLLNYGPGIGIGVGNRGYFGLLKAEWWEFTPN